MTQKHTPGPWAVVEPQSGGWAVQHANMTSEFHNGGYVSAMCVGPDAKANAALIAAAPDLLAEAEANARFLDQLAAHLEANDMPGQAGNCTIRAKATRAAIAKAEDRS